MAASPEPKIFSGTPEWRVAPGLSEYEPTVRHMEEHVARMLEGSADELVWLVEHPPVITAGTSAEEQDLKEPGRFPLIETGRGGRLTYHGPGQRVVYPMLDLNRRGRDVRSYVAALEAWAINALADFGIEAFPHEAGTGIWVRNGDDVAKIGAIGVRVRRWVSFHGLSLNVSTDLSHYSAIVPCGIAEHGVARLQDYAPKAQMQDLDTALLRHFPRFLSEITHAMPHQDS